MGMDVYGRHPNRPAGRYFGANIWSWSPIRQLCVELCSDLLDEDTLIALSFNDGAGPTDQETCSKMADRFSKWLAKYAVGGTLDLNLNSTTGQNGVSETLSDEKADLKLKTFLEDVDDDRIRQWITFLRCCGGFAVW